MTRPAVTLWRFTFARVVAVLLTLMALLGAVGYILVTRPALDRHARSLAATLVPPGTVACQRLELHLRQLAADPSSGVRLAAAPQGAPPSGAWLLPFDAMLVARLTQRSGAAVAGHSGIDTLILRLPCVGGEVALVLDRQAALGAAPDAALLAWVGGLAAAALGLAAWLSSALNAPLRRLAGDLRGTPLGAGSGGGGALAGTGIVELDRLASEIDSLRERAGTAVASRTALLMGLSHDLRTPLARVRLILDTAQPLSAGDAQEIKAHLLEMQDGMDEFMRAANAMAAAPQDRGARVVWSRLASHFANPRVSFAAKDAELDTALNSAALLRVASNLVDNALRHGRGNVGVSWQAGGGRWRLCVADEGPGIAAADMPRALRPFGSTKAGTHVGASHAGVGLALARILCEHNGWELRLGPNPGGGLLACVEDVRAG